MIDQQTVQHFVQYSDVFQIPLPFYETQIINPFLDLSISANHGKRGGF